jgi:hypothetical protein
LKESDDFIKHIIRFSKTNIFLIIFVFLLFTQIYPYVHLHHYNDGHKSVIKVSAHPIGDEVPNEHNHHTNEKQHDENDFHFKGDWEYISPKCSEKQVEIYSTFQFSSIDFTLTTYEDSKFESNEPDVIPLLFRIPPSKRAPPSFS